uniref:Putative membrane protein n=1 Tax=Ixodes ricinus TaxID=34613 RepID=A0A147BF60_IXORI
MYKSLQNIGARWVIMLPLYVLIFSMRALRYCRFVFVYVYIYIYIYISLTSGKLKAGPLLLTKTALMLPLKAFRLVQRKKKSTKIHTTEEKKHFGKRFSRKPARMRSPPF